MAEHLEGQDIKVIFTGLHGKVIDQMKGMSFFSRLFR